MTKAIRAALLMLALSASAQAGIIQNGSPDAAPTPTAVVQEEPETEESAEGIIQNGLTGAASEATLNLLQSFLTLF